MSAQPMLAIFAALLVGCAGKYGGTPMAKKVTMPAGGLEAAALPYSVIDARTGRQIDNDAFWGQLGQARAICIGEDHSNIHHHWAQLEITKQLVQRKTAGDRLALGLEMFQRPFQGVVDDYAAKRIDAAALQARAGWEERWGFPFGFYGPIMDLTVAAGGQLLALNAARELTKKVSRKGMAALTPEEKAQVPELDLADAKHRAWFDALMDSMGGTHAHSKPPAEDGAPASPHTGPAMPSADQIYSVQVLWDETMADGAARWLTSNPTGRVIILAGNGHCHDSAIVSRIKRRGIAQVVSIRPVLDIDSSEVLAQPINDFAFVLEASAAIKAKRAEDEKQ
ncbi:MAG: ChaN family lipoprotein [Deltaproteobacteria bacterium]|nr:ChaN family lipoprotein [Deltaproteobacteria bacterium]